MWKALNMLSRHYSVDTQRLIVGMPKGHRDTVGCYASKTKTIYVVNQEKIGDPFVVLHEFYHHLRTIGGKHRGTEKKADKFAQEFIEAYRKIANIV